MREPAHAAERRGAQRIDTGRRALFFSAHSATPREGWVVNLSLNGAALITAAPVPEGTQVDLEIQPKPRHPASGAIFVRGHVVRVKPAGPRDYLMAVHLRVAPPDRERYEPVATIDALVQAAREQLREAPMDAVAVDAFVQQEAPPPKSVASRKRRLWVLLAMLLLALFLGWWLEWDWRRPSTEFASSAAPAAPPGIPTAATHVSDAIARAFEPAGQIPVPEAVEEALASTSAPLDYGIPPDSSRAEIDPDLVLDEAFALMDAGEWEEAGATLRLAKSSFSAEPAARAQTRLGLAHVAWAQGDEAEAEAHVRDAKAVPGLPVEWTAAAAALETAFALGDDAVRAERFRSSIPLEAAVVSGLDVPAGINLVIDKSKFVLQVMREREEVARFPVGLGFQGSTPEGNFVIANMIENPTWYNRGDPVPPGVAENPLGSRWMGLARGDTATVYGIHATPEPESIGREASRGCIRMRPRDVELLFTWCAMGTPVIIVP